MSQCPKCRHEHEYKHCPECGASASGEGLPSAGEERFRKVMRQEINSVLDDRVEKRKSKRKKRPWYEEFVGAKEEDAGDAS